MALSCTAVSCDEWREKLGAAKKACEDPKPRSPEMQGSIGGEAADNLADLWATRADILMNLGGLKRASTEEGIAEEALAAAQNKAGNLIPSDPISHLHHVDPRKMTRRALHRSQALQRLADRAQAGELEEPMDPGMRDMGYGQVVGLSVCSFID
eukprot:Skav217517  [mRNA]  locus=scaffold647:168406:174393:- [translate_table: standard]